MVRRQVAWVSGFAALVAVLVPHVVLAQSGIAGVVRDTSGAILPGVTVEAASPVAHRKNADGRHRE